MPFGFLAALGLGSTLVKGFGTAASFASGGERGINPDEIIRISRDPKRLAQARKFFGPQYDRLITAVNQSVARENAITNLINANATNNSSANAASGRFGATAEYPNGSGAFASATGRRYAGGAPALGFGEAGSATAGSAGAAIAGIAALAIIVLAIWKR